MWITSTWPGPAGMIGLLLLIQGCVALPKGAPEPYECGFILSNRKQIEKFLGPELAVLQPLPGQVIADVGASNGYHLGMLSVLTDSLTLYLEDIDTVCLNETELEKVKNWYGWVRGAPLSNEFHLVAGTETRTGLPDSTFHKILISSAFHHFSEPGPMLADIRGKLRPEGRLYVIENVVEQTGDVRKRICDHPLRSQADWVALFRENGFETEDTHALHREWTRMFVLRPVRD